MISVVAAVTNAVFFKSIAEAVCCYASAESEGSPKTLHFQPISWTLLFVATLSKVLYVDRCAGLQWEQHCQANVFPLKSFQGREEAMGGPQLVA